MKKQKYYAIYSEDCTMIAVIKMGLNFQLRLIHAIEENYGAVNVKLVSFDKTTPRLTKGKDFYTAEIHVVPDSADDYSETLELYEVSIY